MLDYHLHSAFSLDADSSMEEYCEAAMAAGVTELAFTDHIDINYPHKEYEFIFDLTKYSNAIERVRMRFPELNIKKGVEVGFRLDAVDETSKLLDALKPDFVINSVHTVGDYDPYFTDYFTGKNRKEAYDAYMDGLMASLDVPYQYSVIGHIGYVSKRSPFPFPAIQLSDYRDIIDTFLYRVIYTGHGIELNTSSIKNTAETMPALSILRRYRQLGGEIITYGSDAHNIRDFMQHWAKAREMLVNAGFQYVCGFKHMIPSFNPL